MTDSGPPSIIHIWRKLTGGGTPADFLRWEAAAFERYRSATREGLALEARLAIEVRPADILPAMREPFAYWLAASIQSEADWSSDKT